LFAVAAIGDTKVDKSGQRASTGHFIFVWQMLVASFSGQKILAKRNLAGADAFFRERLNPKFRVPP
jgi:hypothetical protein